MSNSKKILLLVAAVVIIALLVFAGVTDAANGTVACPDCDGTVLDCETCGGACYGPGYRCLRCERSFP